MLRKILLLCPALAFALPFIAATPSMARPLSIPAEPVGWCWGGGNNCDIGEDLLLAVCTQTQIFVQTGQDNRAYDCDSLSGPSCLAACDDHAGDAGQTCRSQCDGEGAMFCAPSDLKTRWGGWNDDDDDFDHQRPDFDEQAIFIDTSTCLELALSEL
ncbi:hypothetical protein [Nannocystis bainbridge]|uniref:Uncharacterized protein n=1 Tax=Nannocystis bainbridge TaxID=2995303 RepID=A0ABT5DWC4_9BACT|nr:hypothetical protein [Nannocystis bainbridge]MDC0717937.1 hypothetical protein [Nannocystis bainbridge]